VRDDIAGVVLVGIGLVFGGSVLDRQRQLSAGALIPVRDSACHHGPRQHYLSYLEAI
jgi:hypothetical protein